MIDKPIVSAKSDVEAALPRDQWNRPLIVPVAGHGADCAPRRNGVGCTCMEAYRRASTVAETLDTGFGLHKWEMRLLAQGLAKRPDLVLSVTQTPYGQLAPILDEALDVAGANIASRNGTTMHKFTDMIDSSIPLPEGLPPHIKAMCDVYSEAMEGLKVVDYDRFVVVDKIKVGGTYDKKVLDEKTGEFLIGDVKTGQSLAHLTVKVTQQVAIYAAGDYYDLDENREANDAERDTGLLIWLPWTEDASEAFCEVRRLDLVQGRRWVKHSIRTNDIQSVKADDVMPLVSRAGLTRVKKSRAKKS